MKSFLRFISRNRLYTVIEVAGMAIALAFIVFIGTYVTQESSYDTFVGDDVYVGSDSEFFGLSGSIKGSVEGRYPDIEAICRLIGLKYLSGMAQSVTIGDETMAQNALCVDSSFMSLIPIPMAVGDRNSVLETISSVIISQSFADKWFPEGNAVGNTLDITIDNGKASLTVTGIFEDMERTVLPQCDMIYRLEMLERHAPYITRNGNGTTATLYKIRPEADIHAISSGILGILKESDALYMSGICTEYNLVPFKEIHYGTGSSFPFPFENVADAGLIQGCPAGSARSSWGMELNGNRYAVILFDGDTTAMRLLGVKVLSQNSDPLPNSFYFTRRTAIALGMDMDATLFEYDFGSMNVCGVIDDLWMGNANSTDNDLLVWAVQSSRPEQLVNMRSLVVKANGDPDDAVRAISEFYAAEKPELKVIVDTYENIYRQTYSAENRSLKLIGVFALLTIVLTVMAMAAMSTYYARQRARSAAIRKIMGCPRGEIYTHTLVSFLSASLIAAVIVVPLIYTFTGRWLQTYSYRIGNYWWIYLLALLIVAAIAVVTITYRAVQLMNTNPSTALRKD